MSELQAIETSPVEPNHVVDLTIPEATPWEFEAHFDSMAAKRFVQDSWVHTSIISLFIYFTPIFGKFTTNIFLHTTVMLFVHV